ncbi:MAG: methyltransferase [Myxococcota bacterium]
MGALLFQHRLAVMVGAFGAGMLSAIYAGREGAARSWWDRQLWRWFEDTPTITLAVTGALCVLAFLLRVTAEARLGAAVYGQGETAGLVSGGPYRFLRNPLYAGTFLFFAAATALWAPAPSWLILCVLFFLALNTMVSHEEQLLTRSLGAPYQEYLKRTRRWLPWPSSGAAAASPTGSAYLSAALGNLFFLSLGLFRLGVAAGGPAGALGAANLACLVIWLGVLVARRTRGGRAG